MKKCQWITGLISLSMFTLVVLGQAPLTQVEALLDNWKGESGIRDQLRVIDADPATALSVVAKDRDQSYLRRQKALTLLATFQTPVSSRVLREIADDKDPFYRCLALASLVELEGSQAIPLLVDKLDDQAVCLMKQATDPARTYPMYVSDEAVRLLELITDERFEKETIGSHRATEPWKIWWSKKVQNLEGK